MIIDELIKILENYEIFVDDDYGGSYKSVITYAPDKKVSRAHTPIGTLKIIDTFEEIHKENQELKKELKEKNDFINKLQATKDRLDKYDYERTNQQKEFIEWLEDKLNMCDGFLDTIKSDLEEISYAGRASGKTYIATQIMKNETAKKCYEEVLSKYKEIIGVKDE